MALSDCKFVWKNRKIIPWEQATFHVSCHGLHYGTGVFEGIRCYHTPAGHVCLSSWKKLSSYAIPSKAKACVQYLNSALALEDAIARGFTEAVLLGDDGKLTEGSAENLFVVRGNRLLTNETYVRLH